MKFKVQESKTLDEGKHIGVITKIEYRHEPYEYADVYIESENVTLKAGYPSIVSEKSKFGTLLIKFGAKLLVGQDVDADAVLIGKHCSFLTTMEKSKKDNNTYAKVLPDTVKPLE